MAGIRAALRVGRGAILLLVVAPPLAAAAPAADPPLEFRKALREADAREREWWKTFDARQKECLDAWHLPLKEQYARKVTEPRPDFAPVQALYRDYLAIDEARCRAARALGGSGHAGAGRILLDFLLSTGGEIAKAEAENAWGKFEQVGFAFHQGPSLRLHALWIRVGAIQESLAAAPGAAALLTEEGLRAAAAADGPGGDRVRSVAVVDALARIPGEPAAGVLGRLLQDEHLALRIASLEAVRTRGELATGAVARILADPAPAVRFALLQEVRRSPPRDCRWIPPLVDALSEAAGRQRREVLQTLRALAGTDAGAATADWKAWLGRNRAAVEAGTYAPPAAVAALSAPSAPADSPSFYGIPVESLRVRFALDGWDVLSAPADHEFQRTRYLHDWTTGTREWKKDRESHQEVLARQVEGVVARLPPKARFAVLIVGGAQAAYDNAEMLPEEGMLPAGAAASRQARQFVLDHRVGHHRGLQFLVGTSMEREADTVLLFATGNLRHSRFLLPEAFLAEFRRKNRFRRVLYHAVRFCDDGPEAASILETIATDSGGRYTWTLVPPPR